MLDFRAGLKLGRIRLLHSPLGPSVADGLFTVATPRMKRLRKSKIVKYSLATERHDQRDQARPSATCRLAPGGPKSEKFGEC